ncbi:MAG TPA: adenine phosphoribosyltransferase [Rudaea sp.]|nr:adenine phosphoribosyltransferase [Rudaea sp.]
MQLQHYIRDVPDFPKPGIVFKDITPLLADAAALRECVAQLAAPFRGAGIAAVCGIESRGFIFGAALARELGAGFVPIRKPGKLPARTLGADYALEYGSDRLEIHADALAPGRRTLLVDDVVATGGTLLAARRLIAELGAELAAAAVVIELEFLKARERWTDGVPLHALVRY